MLAHSETQLGKVLLNRFGSILSSGLGREPLLNVDILFQMGNRDATENMRYCKEQIAKAVTAGLIPSQTAVGNADSKIVGNQGIFEFMVFMRTNMELDDRHCNMSVLNQGYPLFVYDQGKKIRTVFATPIKTTYDVRFFTKTEKSVTAWYKKWLRWFTGEYSLKFQVPLKGMENENLYLDMNTVLEVEPPFLGSVNRFEESLFYTVEAKAVLHSLLIEEAAEYLIEEIDVNLYQERMNDNVLMDTVIIKGD